MTGCQLRLWRFGRGRLRPVVGCEDATPPEVHTDETGAVRPVDPSRWLAPVPKLTGYWYEIVDAKEDPAAAGATLAPLLAQLLDGERETLGLAKQRASGFEAIELLYTINEILGQTVRLDEAAERIVKEVSEVVGARRASIFVYEETTGMLEPLAGLGQDVTTFGALRVDDARSIAARVFREGRSVGYDPRKPEGPPPSTSGRGYRGSAFLSVPIRYPTPSGPSAPIGVINLTDRIGADAFSGGERRLIAAIADQIGAAIEHARLVRRDLARQQLHHELELAHDLQLKLLRSPTRLEGETDVAARCVPAASVGGDFYHIVRLPGGQIGVMLGDVSSHGFGAALIMALVLSAAGIYAEEGGSPDGTLRRLLESIAEDLAETEMHLSLFYGVVDPEHGVLRYANAGHPHAFCVAADGTAERLGSTSPPLGLVGPEAITAARRVWKKGSDRLVLFSDGIVDARDADGEHFGEERILKLVAARASAPTKEVADAIVEAVAAHEEVATDDRTVLVLRA